MNICRQCVLTVWQAAPSTPDMLSDRVILYKNDSHPIYAAYHPSSRVYLGSLFLQGCRLLR